MSSKTPGRDLEDRWSLDRFSDVESWWKFNRSFWRMIPIIWHHLQVHQEPPCPPRLQEESWQGSWFNFHRSLLRMISIIWHNLQVHQEHMVWPTDDAAKLTHCRAKLTNSSAKLTHGAAKQKHSVAKSTNGVAKPTPKNSQKERVKKRWTHLYSSDKATLPPKVDKKLKRHWV